LSHVTCWGVGARVRVGVRVDALAVGAQHLARGRGKV